MTSTSRTAPHVFVDAEDYDAIEASRILDQHPSPSARTASFAVSQATPKAISDACHGEVLHHDRLECPPQRAARELRSWFGCLGGVLAPHMHAVGAAAATDLHDQDGRSPAEWLVGQGPGHGIAWAAFSAAASRPLVRFENPTRQDRTIGLETLADHDEVELVESAELGHVRASEGSVRHVEVFQMVSVRTSILGRPRLLSGH